MEITLKDIFKAILRKWYIMLAAVSILTMIGTAIGVNNYNKPTYTASASYLFSNLPAANVSLYVGNCKAYLQTSNLTYEIQDEMKETFGETVEYEVSIETTSALMSVTVTADSEAVALAVMNAYESKITADDNPVKKEDFSIESLFPIEARENTPSLSSLLIQIVLFTVIGAFIGGVIVLMPIYNAKVKEEKRRLAELEKKDE
jgi:capsular polysaccharide biosynthesis protein